MMDQYRTKSIAWPSQLAQSASGGKRKGADLWQVQPDNFPPSRRTPPPRRRRPRASGCERAAAAPGPVAADLQGHGVGRQHPARPRLLGRSSYPRRAWPCPIGAWLRAGSDAALRNSTPGRSDAAVGNPTCVRNDAAGDGSGARRRNIRIRDAASRQRGSDPRPRAKAPAGEEFGSDRRLAMTAPLKVALVADGRISTSIARRPSSGRTSPRSAAQRTLSPTATVLSSRADLRAGVGRTDGQNGHAEKRKPRQARESRAGLLLVATRRSAQTAAAHSYACAEQGDRNSEERERSGLRHGRQADRGGIAAQ